MEKTSIAGLDQADPTERIVAVLAATPDLSTDDIATRVGLAYSTTTPKLRAMQEQGLAERRKVDGRNLWRLTAASTGPSDAIAGEPNRTGEQTGIVDQQADHEPEPDQPDITAGPPAHDDGDTDAAETDRPDEGWDDVAGQDARPGSDAVPPTDGAGGADGGVEPRVAPIPPDDAADEDRHRPQGPRRGKGVLRAQVLRYMQDHPDQTFRPLALSKALDGASSGAISNALDKLTRDGSVIRTCEKPATYQAA